MAEYDRNRGYSSRYGHWSDRNRDRRWDEDRDGYSPRQTTAHHDDDDDDSGWQSRYEREEYHRGGYPGGYRSDSEYGREPERWGKSYGRSRNLYDRDYESLGRRGYHTTRMGGANYGRYGNMDRGYGAYRTYEDPRYTRQHYGRRYEDHAYDDDRDERSWWDRTRDEVSSWFGDEDAERRRAHDRQVSHRGKGPRNYSRSDQRILEDVNDRLSDDPFVDATEIEVTVSNGEVMLMGTVEDRASKRRAEDLADAVSGVKNVENRLRVGMQSSVPDTGEPTGGSASGSSSSRRERTKGDYVTG